MFEINVIGVLVATVAGMALGAFWYSPGTFGPAWRTGEFPKRAEDEIEFMVYPE